MLAQLIAIIGKTTHGTSIGATSATVALETVTSAALRMFCTLTVTFSEGDRRGRLTLEGADSEFAGRGERAERFIAACWGAGVELLLLTGRRTQFELRESAEKGEGTVSDGRLARAEKELNNDSDVSGTVES